MDASAAGAPRGAEGQGCRLPTQLYEGLVYIVSLLYQTMHVLQIRDSGNLVEVRRIGAFCREDDELFLHSHVQVSANGGTTALLDFTLPYVFFFLGKHL